MKPITLALLFCTVMAVMGLAHAAVPTDVPKIFMEEKSNTEKEVTVEVRALNPKKQGVVSYQLWLTYDATKLTPTTLTMEDKIFSIVSPEEQLNKESQGVLRFARATAVEGGMAEADMVLGTLQFTKVEGAKGKSTIGFYTPKEGEEERISMNIIEDGLALNIVQRKHLEPLSLAITAEPAKVSATAPKVLYSTEEETSSGSLVDVLSEGDALKGVAETPSSPTIQEGMGGPVEKSTSLHAPQGLQYQTVGGQVTITWNTQAEAYGHYVYYTPYKNTYLHRKKVLSGNSHTFEGLEVGKPYYFVVTAFDVLGKESPYSYEMLVEVGTQKSIATPLPEEVLYEVAPVAEASMEKLKEVPRMPENGNALPTALLLVGALLGGIAYKKVKV